jgi:hypothetical protein
MPLTEFQAEVMRLLAPNRSKNSYMAGATALHFRDSGLRYSNDLDFFHDSPERVAAAFKKDRAVLLAAGLQVETLIAGDHMMRAKVRRDQHSTQIDWSHDSAWRFLPLVACPELGWRLHDIDLAVNKVLALVGRDELRDLLDVLYIDQNILGLGALCWAAGGKDPGLTPLYILDGLKAKGRVAEHELEALALVEPARSPVQLRIQWDESLRAAERFIESRPAAEMGCLYFSAAQNAFVEPAPDDSTVRPHFGRPGGVLAQLK